MTVYLLGLHSFLVLTVQSPDIVLRVAAKLGLRQPILHPTERDLVIEAMGWAHRITDRSVQAGSVIFLGDSLTAALETSLIVPNAVNYGIYGQRSDQLLRSLDIYESLKRSKLIVVTIGTNDLIEGRDDGIGLRYEAILAKLPANVPVILSSVPPLGSVLNGRIIISERVLNVVVSARTACQKDHHGSKP